MLRRGHTTRGWRRLCARREAGFALFEVTAAALVLALGIGALTTVLVSSRKLVNDTERREAAVHIAEQAIEDLQAVSYSSLGLTSTPSQSSDPYNPNYYVNGTSFRPDQRNPTSPLEPLVLGGSVAPT